MINAEQFGKRLDVWVTQVEKTTTAKFRSESLSLFKFILETTPQASGRAVANWKIGINAPDTSWESDVGDQPEILDTKSGDGAYLHRIQFRQKGDPKWIKYALLQESYKLGAGSRGSNNRLKLGDTLYITNNVQGDGGEMYLDKLQFDWSGLREANKPYVTAAEALLIHSWGAFADGGSTHLDLHL